MSKNIFDCIGDSISIMSSKKDYIGFATIRNDYKDEIMSYTWTKKDKYLYNSKNNISLHRYIMEKWYGAETVNKMRSNGFIIDHIDNDGCNCRISNLAFLPSDENKAKGMTLDKLQKNKLYIALTITNDFNTDYKQISIAFNYPAIGKISSVKKPILIITAHLQYDCSYERVINDAREILYRYYEDFSFEPEKLNHIRSVIEAEYGVAMPIEKYNDYISGKHGHGVSWLHSIGPIAMSDNDKQHILCICE